MIPLDHKLSGDHLWCQRLDGVRSRSVVSGALTLFLSFLGGREWHLLMFSTYFWKHSALRKHAWRCSRGSYGMLWLKPRPAWQVPYLLYYNFSPPFVSLYFLKKQESRDPKIMWSKLTEPKDFFEAMLLNYSPGHERGQAKSWEKRCVQRHAQAILDGAGTGPE